MVKAHKAFRCVRGCVECGGLGVVVRHYPKKGPRAWVDVIVCPNADHNARRSARAAVR